MCGRMTFDLRRDVPSVVAEGGEEGLLVGSVCLMNAIFAVK